MRGFNLNLLFWSFLAMFADGYDISVMPFAMPTLSKLWHVNPGIIGWALSASLVGVLAGAPLLGHGRRPLRPQAGDSAGQCHLRCDDAGGALAARVLGHPGTALLYWHWHRGTDAQHHRPELGTFAQAAAGHPGGVDVHRHYPGQQCPGLLSAWLPHSYGWSALFVVGGSVPLLVAACLYFALPESVKFLGGQPQRRGELLATARRMRPDLALGEDTQFEAIARPEFQGHDLGMTEIFGSGFAWITPLLWVCFATTLMANYFLNSWMPLLFNNAGLAPDKAGAGLSLYHIGGTVGGLLISVLLDRFGFVVIAALFLCAAPAIAAVGASGMSYGELAPLVSHCRAGVLGAQFGNNAAAGLLYPTQFRSNGVGWALAIGRFWRHRGSGSGRTTGRHASAHAPAVSGRFHADAGGFIAAVVLVVLCYRRLGTLRLSDVPIQR